MLEAIDLSARRGFTQLFARRSFRVEPACVLMVTGANGTGKTTLLRILAGLCEPSDGRVRWRGADVAPFAERLRHDVVYCGHHAALKDGLTVEENLASLVMLAGERANAADIRTALAGVALDKQMRLPARALSQGQRRRLGLARLHMSRRPLWLLDEPATALDHDGIALLTRLLTSHLERGGCAVVATHQALALPAASVQALALS
jgi:heme exporter protein A